MVPLLVLRTWNSSRKQKSEGTVLLVENRNQVYRKMAQALCYSSQLVGGRSGFLTLWNPASSHYQPCFRTSQLKTKNALHLWLNLLSHHLLTLIESLLCAQHLPPLFNLHSYASRGVLLSPKYRDGNWDLEKLSPEVTQRIGGKTHFTARNYMQWVWDSDPPSLCSQCLYIYKTFRVHLPSS